MENISYGELAEIQYFAEHAIAFWKREFGCTPMNPDEAEQAVRRAYVEEWIDTKEPWKYLKERLELIVEQIGFMVEG